MRLSVFIEAPYDHLVTAATRFWNASGIDLSAGSGGFRLKTGTVATILSGGIAFSTPDDAPPAPETEPAIYRLAPDEESAMAPADGPPITFRLRFDRALHGLSIGAPVAFSSVVIGRVKAINTGLRPAALCVPDTGRYRRLSVTHGQCAAKVAAACQRSRPGDGVIYPRTGIARFTGASLDRQSADRAAFRLHRLFPERPAVPFDLDAVPLRIPTIGGSPRMTSNSRWPVSSIRWINCPRLPRQ